MFLLRDLRTAKGMSMKELGNIFGLAESTISLYETEKRQPDFSTLIKFAEYFDVSVDYLLGRKDKRKGNNMSIYAFLKENELYEEFKKLKTNEERISALRAYGLSDDVIEREFCNFSTKSPLDFSADAIAIAGAYDRADDRAKNVVKVALDPFMEKNPKEKVG